MRASEEVPVSMGDAGRRAILYTCRNGLRRLLLFTMAALSIGMPLPAFAQEEGVAATANEPATASDPIPTDDRRAVDAGGVDEMVVTARRREERALDVPISMTVFNQEQLDDRNIVNALDLATYTPSLTANSRFGDDSTSFAIRGFTQELRTTASVGVYFADVVAPRGGGSITAGDGAGPGSFWDLQNVQVLKGPQGTLFGRNTTGGAVLLVPVKPTDQLEGYVEGSIGDFDMMRGQGVLNVPVNDSMRFRVGFDRQLRDGYLQNTSGIGPRDLSDVDYIATRASMVVDVENTVGDYDIDIENYTIFSYVNSENNGGVAQVSACNEDALIPGLGSLCAAQLASQGDSFYEVGNGVSNPKSQIDQWQLINTTTWLATDYLTVKNIFSFANLRTTLRTAVFGTDFQYPTPTGPLPVYFSTSGQVPGIPTTSQDSFVEEIRFQGQGFDDRLVWQGGFYYERSQPDGISGSQSPSFMSCDLDTLQTDPDDFRCNNVLGLPLGAVTRSLGTIDYDNKALYTQATFDLVPDLLHLTGGFRYTWDETSGTSNQSAWRFPTLSEGGFAPPDQAICANSSGSYPDCAVDLNQNSNAPTGLVGLDWNPTDDALLYAKYARGYRQGSVNIFGPEGLNTFGPENVNTYEAGAKTVFGGPFPGSFNLAGFYNDFQDQQIQVGVISDSLVPTTSIVNAGSSRIWGIETEANFELFDGFHVNGAYTYLNTKLEDLDLPELPPSVLVAIPSAAEGDPLPFTPEHQLVATASYLLPFIPDRAGDVILAATFIYNSDQQAVTESASPFAIIPSYELLNLNLNWNRIADLPVDASLFVTNVLDEEYWTTVNGTYNSTGLETRVLGQPRMIGARLRYSFSL